MRKLLGFVMNMVAAVVAATVFAPVLAFPFVALALLELDRGNNG